jgi:hypothetical protein
MSLSQDVPTWSKEVMEFSPYTALYNVTGQPSMSVPIHWTPDGLPVGVMFLGPIRRRCDSVPIGCSTRKSTALGQAQTPTLNIRILSHHKGALLLK